MKPLRRRRVTGKRASARFFVVVSLSAAAACGLKTWAAVAKRANNLRVDQKDSIVMISPAARGPKQAFHPLPDRNMALDSPSDAEPGLTIMSELDSRQRRPGIAIKSTSLMDFGPLAFRNPLCSTIDLS